MRIRCRTGHECVHPLQLLLQGFSQQEEVKQPHWKKPNIMKYVVPPEAPDHLPNATQPCLPEQCSHYGKNFSRKSNLSKNMFEVLGASRPSKILQDIYLANLMVHRSTSFASSATSPTRQGSALRSLMG